MGTNQFMIMEMPGGPGRTTGAASRAGEGTVRRYHHIGIPTDLPREGEVYIEAFKTYASGFETSPYGVEWMRYEPGAPVVELVRTVPHVAFEVDDLDAELVGKQILIAPNSPSPGVRVAFIVDGGAPIEFLEFRSPDDPRRKSGRDS